MDLYRKVLHKINHGQHLDDTFNMTTQVKGFNGGGQIMRSSGLGAPSNRRYGAQVNDYLKSEDIHRIDQSTRSPDLNSVQYVLDALGKQFYTLSSLFKNHHFKDKSCDLSGLTATRNSTTFCLECHHDMQLIWL
ncbi:hypothetical protein TNCV_3637411 [Trichonephila clavipes]|nr:hypothetical protein TNCV_3637411 [Trichonephila clavipes]